MEPWILILLMVAAVLLWTRLWPGLTRGRTSKRCSRCWRAVPRLQPYVDGRREFWVCAMCAAEMDFSNASHVDIPRG